METADIDVVLVQDTREQFGYSYHFSHLCVVDTLQTGDYSVAGLQDMVAVERKSLPDLLQSLTRGRERFEKELARARSFHRFWVIVETDPRTILRGDFEDKSLADPRSIWESVMALSVRFCPFLFGGNDRATCAAMVESLLVKYAREFLKTAETVTRAHRTLNLDIRG